jgi:hypothetical protein
MLHVGTASVIYSTGGCSAFETPRLTYCPERKKYLPDSLLGRPLPNLLSTAAMKNSIYMDRSVPVLSIRIRSDGVILADPYPFQPNIKKLLFSINFQYINFM